MLAPSPITPNTMSDHTYQPRFIPLNSNVAIRLDPREETSAGGIAIPERAQKTNQFGYVVEVGSRCGHLRPGFRVVVPAHLGTELTATDGTDLLVIEELKVLAIVSEQA